MTSKNGFGLIGGKADLTIKMTMKKTITVISKETAEFASNELAKIFPKLDKEPTYSLGFQRWLKLNLEKRKAVMIRNEFNYQDCLRDLELAGTWWSL